MSGFSSPPLANSTNNAQFVYNIGASEKSLYISKGFQRSPSLHVIQFRTPQRPFPFVHQSQLLLQRRTVCHPAVRQEVSEVRDRSAECNCKRQGHVDHAPNCESATRPICLTTT